MRKFLLSFFIVTLALYASFSPMAGLKVFAVEGSSENEGSTLEPIDTGVVSGGIGNESPQDDGTNVDNPNAATDQSEHSIGSDTGQGNTAGGANNPGGSNNPNSNAETTRTVGCINFLPYPSFHMEACVANIVYLIMWIFSWILWLAGLILDMSIYYTINMSDLLTHVPVVDIGWKIFRDLANIFFIFILLWVAIGTILGLISGKTKEIIVHLVIVALLMNFSLFITKTVIDASNIVAIHFYKLIITPVPIPSGTASQTLISYVTPNGEWFGNSSFSGAFMEGLKIQTLFQPQTAGGQTVNSTLPGSFFSNQFGGAVDSFKVILIGGFGIALMMVAAYVFFVAAILFMYRLVTLMMVMILSPIAFLAFVLPSTEHYAEEWKEKLIGQSIFAPIYLAICYVVVKTIQSPAFSSVMSVNHADTTASVMSAAALIFGADNGSTAGFAFIFNFILLIGLMLGSIIVAHKMEAGGVEFATEAGKTAGGFIGRSIARGRYVPTVAAIANKVPGLGALGRVTGQGLQKISGFEGIGKGLVGISEKIKTKEGREKLEKAIDINELDKKFKQSKFGAGEFGSFLREKTTGGALFGVGAKFGGEKSVHEAYEESEKLRSRRFAIEKMETAEQSRGFLELAEAKRFAKQPNWQDKKYRNDDGTFKQAEFDTDFKKFIETYNPEEADFMPEQYAAKYRNIDGTFNQALFDKDKAINKVELNKKYKKADGTFDQGLYDADVVLAKAEHAEAKKRFDLILASKPDRSKFAIGPAGDILFGAEQENYEKLLAEPNRKDYATTKLYENAKKLYENRDKKRDYREKAVESQKAALGYALNQVTADEFADMDEHRIEKMARYANLRQLKAVLASEHWTVPEKQEMLGIRWKPEVDEFKHFSESVMQPYKDALNKLADAFRAQTLDVDDNGTVEKKREGTAGIEDQVIIDPTDGKKYALLSSLDPTTGKRTQLKNADGSDQRLLLPEEPALPSHLKGWARNKMTKEEYELAASVLPTLFDNPDLVHVIRWGLTNKEFRTNENMDYNLRDRLTYIKDSDLDTIVEKANHPDYIAEDSEETRRAAFDAASKAAEAARTAAKLPEEIEKVFRKTYARMTVNDTLRRQVAVSWADGRAPNEIAGARGRNRNSVAVHRLIDSGVVQHFKEKDSEDIKMLLEDVLRDYQAEQDGRGIVSDENRDLIRYLFTDPRSKTIARPIGKLDADLQAIYRELESQGNYTAGNTIAFRSDAWRKTPKKKP